nr:unnamed protein product [Callosobruchus analis]
MSEENVLKITSKRSFDEYLVTHSEVASDLKHSLMEKSKLSWKQHQVINEAVHSESFSCYICNYTAFSKHQLVDHMNVHDNKNCVPGCIKKDHCNVNTTIKTVSPDSCSHCASFRVRKALGDHVLKKRPDFISSVTSKIHICPECHHKTVRTNVIKLHECTKCTFKTALKPYFDKHLRKHSGLASDFKQSGCVHCNATFKSKKSLDDHVVRKHPDFISSVTSKLYECTKCTFKAASKSSFDKHLLKHSDFKHIRCVHCNATFKRKTSLNDHVVRKHPDLIPSITNKLHQCTKCTFKTTSKGSFDKHLLKHSDFKHITCVHCNATFKSKLSLDDHVVRKHLDFISTVTNKLHECTKCTFKTVRKTFGETSLGCFGFPAQHSSIVTQYSNTQKCIISRKQQQVIKEAVGSETFSCYICNYTAFSKHHLIDHMIVHDNEKYGHDHSKRECWNANISNKTVKVVACSHCDASVDKSIIFRKQRQVINKAVDNKSFCCYICNYTAFSKHHLIDHMIVHDNEKNGPNYSKRNGWNSNITHKTVNSGACGHCDASFRDKRALDDHVLKKHPNFISSITSKIHRCPECHYKTVRKDKMKIHMSVHFKREYNPFGSQNYINNHNDLTNLICLITLRSYNLVLYVYCNMISINKISLEDRSFYFLLIIVYNVIEYFYMEFSVEKSIIFRKQREVINEAVDSESFSCYICSYSAFSKHHLIDHMIVHDNEKYGPDYSKGSGWNANISQKTVNPGACSHCDASFRGKRALDDHVLKKHPNFISSITSKIHRCPECHYATVRKVGKHPDFISSITSKLYECTKCSYKTVKKCFLDKHLLKHPGLASNFKHKTCVHCNAKFRSKLSLDDHIVRKHPDFMSSITSKLHECTICTFKTVRKCSFGRHLVALDSQRNTHPFVKQSIIFRKQRQVINKAVDSKSFSCYICNYTAFSKHHLVDHMTVHDKEKYGPDQSKRSRRDANRSHKTVNPGACSHCDASFRRKRALDDHVLKKHPNFISSITNKIHRCPECHYETVKKHNMNAHMSVHLKTGHKPIHPHCYNDLIFSFSVEKSITFRKQRQVINEAVDSESFSCYICSYSAFSKHHLIDHMIVHDSEKYGPDYSESDDCHANMSHETVSPGVCSHCDASFRDKRALDDHVLKKHPNFISSITSKIHRCPECHYATVRKYNMNAHVIIFKEQRQVMNGAVDSTSFRCYICNYTAFSKNHLIEHMIVHDNEKYEHDHSKRDGWNANISNKTVKLRACSHCDASVRDKER